MLYYDDFMEAIENLPSEIADSLSSIRQLDGQVQGSLCDVQALTRAHFDSSRHRLSEYDRTVQANSIIKEYNSLLAMSSSKKEVAEKLFTLYDKVTRKLDCELEKFRMELEADNCGITEQIEQRMQNVLGKGSYPAAKPERRRIRFRGQHSAGAGSSHHHIKTPLYMRRKLLGSALRNSYNRKSGTRGHPASVGGATAASSTSSVGRPLRRLSGGAGLTSSRGGSSTRRERPVPPLDDYASTSSSAMLGGQFYTPNALRRTHTEVDTSDRRMSTSTQPSPSNRQSTPSSSSGRFDLSSSSVFKPKSEYDFMGQQLMTDVPSIARNSPYRQATEDSRFGRLDYADQPATTGMSASGSSPAAWSSSSATALQHRQPSKSGRPGRRAGRAAADTAYLFSSDDNASLHSWRSMGSDSPPAPTRGRRPADYQLTQQQLMADDEADEDEQRYCLCHDVSYGDMVACDGTGCIVEWFHYACVGLAVAPKGQWFCPSCSTTRGPGSAVKKRHKR